MSSGPVVCYQLRWPREGEGPRVQQAMRLMATTAGEPVILEAEGTTHGVEHRLSVSLGRTGVVVHQLRATIPGLSIEKLDERPATPLNRAVALRLSTRRRPLRTEDLNSVSTALLTALANVGTDERLVLQWILGKRLPSTAIPNRLEGSGEPTLLLRTLAQLVTGPPPPTDPEARNALRAKQAEAGWKVAGRLGVWAEGKSRQRQLIRQVLGALQSAEAPGVGFWVHTTDPRRVAQARAPWRRPTPR